MKFPKKSWKNISTNSILFIKKLIEINPAKRYSAKEAINDVWIQQIKSEVIIDLSLVSSTVLNFERYLKVYLKKYFFFIKFLFFFIKFLFFFFL